jgi:hypothetical protein
MQLLARSRFKSVPFGLGLGALAAIAIVLAVSVSSGPQATRGRTAFSNGPLPTHGPVALGVNVASGPSPEGLRSFAHLVGATPRILMWYQGWNTPLVNPANLRGTAAAGAVPMITWDPQIGRTGIPFSAIDSGRYDPYIAASARAARAWGRPLYIRLAHEMNLPASEFGPGRKGDTARTFVLAWRHILSIFRRYRATNVSWVWSPNVDCEGRCPFSAFFPGNAWVNWVALDGYNYAAVDHVPWLSFSQIFAPSYATLEQLTHKPVMIAETASAGIGGNKASWIRQISPTLRSSLRRVHALIWFQRIKETDWRVNSSPAALAAFQQLVHSPPFSR